ncbi:MAG TPA: isoprenylcysteine carboxylmethyltransferase family protein [Burkholderiales bacterium]|nr:isoprenylcysteine carboxylmethyltransferase family protein [Burkholderiales bacterium]
MHALELKIPPPLVALSVAIAMWSVASFVPLPELPPMIRKSVAIAMALAGGAFDIAGALSFRRARTTINPMKPYSTTALVSSGVYRITRNPMYVGLLFVLVSWAVFLSSAWALLGPLAFCLYIGRFQIAPEERVLSELFGNEYLAYKVKVRRWL